jgi:hypothetical protein
MDKHRKLLDTILRGSADANISFKDLRALLEYLGFSERVRGSHHLFTRSGVVDKINVQADGAKAKVYQVRQIRGVILKYNLGGDD